LAQAQQLQTAQEGVRSRISQLQALDRQVGTALQNLSGKYNVAYDTTSNGTSSTATTSTPATPTPATVPPAPPPAPIGSLVVTAPAGPLTVSPPQTTATISGTATGVYGTQALIRLWKGNPAVPSQKDTSTGAEVMIGRPIPLMLTGTPVTFNMTNIPLLPNAPNYFVVTISDAYGNNESIPVPVPPITQTAMGPQTVPGAVGFITITSPLTPTTIYAPQSNVSVTGTVTGTYVGQALVRLWKSSAVAPNQKDFSTGAEIQIGQSVPVMMSGAPVPFTVPNIPLIPYSVNYFVATVADQYGNNESNPVPIPVITQSGTLPMVQTYTLTVTSPNAPTTVYPPQTAIPVSGMVNGTPGVQALVRVWLANAAAPYQKDVSTGAPVQVGYLPPLVMTGAPVQYTFPAIVLTPNSPNYFVVTASDQYGNNETTPVPVPAISTVTGVTSTSSVTVTNPSAPMTVYPPQTTVAVGGTVNGAAGTQALVRLWLANAAAPYQKDLSSGHEIQVGYLPPIPLMGIAAPYTFLGIPLAQNAANYFVVTVSDQYGNNESLPVPVPVITQGTAVAQSAYSATITSPATPLTVYPPLTTATIGGTATGPAGTIGLVRAWKGSATAPNQKDLSTGTEVQVGYLQVTLSGGPVPFTLSNIALALNAANYFVVTVSDQYGNNESNPVTVPVITQGTGVVQSAYSATITSPAMPLTVYPPLTTAAISGTATGPAGTIGLVRAWRASATAPNQKDLSTGTQVQVGYLEVMLTAGPVPFTLSNIALALNAANYFVLTVSDQYGNNESNPVVVPVITQGTAVVQSAYSATITSPAMPLTVYPPLTTAAISGMATGPAGTIGLVRAWKASATAPNQKDNSTGTAVQVGYLQLTLTGVPMPFTLSNIALALNAANYFVVTVSDQYGNNESNPVAVPVITQGTAVVQGGYSATITSPTSPLTVYAPHTTASISGTAIGPAGTQGLVRVWKASAAMPNQKDLSTGYEVQVGYAQSITFLGGPTGFTIPSVPLATHTVNYFVVTVSDQYGNNESMPVPVQPITQTAHMAHALIVRKPSAPCLVEEESYTIRGKAAPDSLVQVWFADEECEKRPGGHALGAAQLTGSDTHYAITIPLPRNQENRFVVTAICGGVESPPVPVPTITHRGPQKEIAEETIVDEIVEEERIEESRVKPKSRAAGRRRADEGLDD